MENIGNIKIDLFCFRLALALGITVKQLTENISSEELSVWMALDQVERASKE